MVSPNGMSNIMIYFFKKSMVTTQFMCHFTLHTFESINCHHRENVITSHHLWCCFSRNNNFEPAVIILGSGLWSETTYKFNTLDSVFCTSSSKQQCCACRLRLADCAPTSLSESCHCVSLPGLLSTSSNLFCLTSVYSCIMQHSNTWEAAEDMRWKRVKLNFKHRTERRWRQKTKSHSEHHNADWNLK